MARNSWREDEISKLKENYRHKSPEELSQIIKRGKYGIVAKLMDLAGGEDWDEKRIKSLYSGLQREYRETHFEQIKRVNKEREDRIDGSKQVHQKFLEKEAEWDDPSIALLANTYFNHNLTELINIFCLKNKEVHIKLRELYLEDKHSWDIARITELENEAKKLPLIEINGQAVSNRYLMFYEKIAKHRKKK